MQEMM